MKLGFSLSPGGLLLPYHLGVLDCLRYHGYLDVNTPIAGASAGAIATAVEACQIDSKKVLDSTIEISDRCNDMGGARGRLLPLLREKLDLHVQEEQLHNLQSRPEKAGVAYQQLFPTVKPILQTEFQNKQDLIDAVSFSSSFPFFASNSPVALDMSTGSPRVFVDGFFTVPRERYGCPDFTHAGMVVEKTVMVCVFPLQGPEGSVICPQGGKESNRFERLLRIATQPSSKEELIGIYDDGWSDAERWCKEEAQRLVETNEREKLQWAVDRLESRVQE